MRETFSGPPSITQATMRLWVVRNNLTNSAYVQWELNINGIGVGTFTISQGVTGSVTVSRSFPSITGPSYTFKIKVINQVPTNGGAITLAYDCHPHGVAVS